MIDSHNIHRRITFILQGVLVLEVVLAIVSQQWLTVFITGCIILITLAPFFLARLFHLFIPPEIVLVIIAFIFASLFLGEIHDYYARI
jgi:hypothetical protein